MGLEKSRPTNEMVKCLVNGITVYDAGELLGGMHSRLMKAEGPPEEEGRIVIDFKM
jgi:hypothetical protein